MNVQREKRARWCALGSLLGVLVFVLLVGALHVFNPQMNPVSVPISSYVTGHAGFLMTVAFLARGCGELLLFVGLALGITRDGRSWTGLTLLGIATACTFLVAIFPGLVAPFVPGGFQNTSALFIHSLGALVGFSCLALSPLFWANRLRKDPRWRSSAPVSLVLGLLILLSLLAFLATIKDLAGLTERVLEIFIVCWLGFLAWRLYTLGSSQALAAED